VLALSVVLLAPTAARGDRAIRGTGVTPGAALPYQVDGVSTKEQRSAVARTGAAIEAVRDHLVWVRATPAEVVAIRALGFKVSALSVRQNFPPGYEDYHNYAEMAADINAVQAAYPDIVSVVSIGTSWEGRDIWAAKVSDNVAVDEDEPEVLLDGLHHAREHLTPEMMLFALHMFTDKYGTNGQITQLVNSREIWIVFMLNTDGEEYDIQGDTFHYWRKNRQPNPGSQFVGTDLNRNYGYRWGCCGGSSGDPSSETYRGASPFSAPESMALADFVDSRVVGDKQQITAGISFHTYGQLVMWPYGYTFDDIPADMRPIDHRVFVKMGTVMANTTCKQGDCYTPQQMSNLYITDGTSVDWMYGAHRIFEFTIEMYPSCCDFYQTDDIITRETTRLRKAVLYLTTHADCPYEVIGQQCSKPE
jgi:carboxypeptidase T